MREPDVPAAVEKKAWGMRNADRYLAHRYSRPYCFKCDQLFKDAEALGQHNKAKHSETETCPTCGDAMDGHFNNHGCETGDGH